MTTCLANSPLARDPGFQLAARYSTLATLRLPFPAPGSPFPCSPTRSSLLDIRDCLPILPLPRLPIRPQGPYIQDAHLGRAQNEILRTFDWRATNRARSPLIPQSLSLSIPTLITFGWLLTNRARLLSIPRFLIPSYPVSSVVPSRPRSLPSRTRFRYPLALAGGYAACPWAVAGRRVEGPAGGLCVAPWLRHLCPRRPAWRDGQSVYRTARKRWDFLSAGPVSPARSVCTWPRSAAT